MMIAELIDGDDFRARLSALGIEIPADAQPATAAQHAASAHQQSPVPGLVELVDELVAQQDMVLPEVRTAIAQYLPPEKLSP